MAEKLKKHAFPKPGRRPKYNWAEWTDGAPWLLKEGIDYESRSGVIAAAKQKAWRLNLHLSIDQTDPTQLVIQFFQK